MTMQVTQTGMAPAAAWPSDTNMAPGGGPAYTPPLALVGSLMVLGATNVNIYHTRGLWHEHRSGTSTQIPVATGSWTYLYVVLSNSSGQVVTMAPGGYVGHSDWHGTVATQPLDTSNMASGGGPATGLRKAPIGNKIHRHQHRLPGLAAPGPRTKTSPWTRVTT